jgi:hypothetical protein
MVHITSEQASPLVNLSPVFTIRSQLGIQTLYMMP